MGIQHSFGYSVRKCAFVERFNRTIQDLIAREASANGSDISLRWVDYVDRALFKYNNVNIHSFTKMTPAKAELPQSQEQLKYRFKLKYSKVKKKKARFVPGDLVRVWRDKGKFKRSYFNDFSDELFTINRVFKNLKHPRYELRDGNGLLIKGNWIQEELSPYSP